MVILIVIVIVILWRIPCSSDSTSEISTLLNKRHLLVVWYKKRYCLSLREVLISKLDGTSNIAGFYWTILSNPLLVIVILILTTRLVHFPNLCSYRVPDTGWYVPCVPLIRASVLPLEKPILKKRAEGPPPPAGTFLCCHRTFWSLSLKIGRTPHPQNSEIWDGSRSLLKQCMVPR